MNRVVIFGATGNIGLHAIEAAVKQGKNVRVFVRDPNKIPEHLQSKVEVIQGDVTNEPEVHKAIEGEDGVLVALGTRNDVSPTTVLSEGMKNIISGMKKAGVEHVSVCLSAFLLYEPEKVPAIMKDLNADHQRMFDYLKNSELKWVAVLPPRFTDNPSAKYTVTHNSSPGRTIAKCDLAAFMLESLSNPEHYNQTCGIANV